MEGAKGGENPALGGKEPRCEYEVIFWPAVIEKLGIIRNLDQKQP